MPGETMETGMMDLAGALKEAHSMGLADRQGGYVMTPLYVKGLWKLAWRRLVKAGFAGAGEIECHQAWSLGLHAQPLQGE